MMSLVTTYADFDGKFYMSISYDFEIRGTQFTSEDLQKAYNHFTDATGISVYRKFWKWLGDESIQGSMPDSNLFAVWIDNDEVVKQLTLLLNPNHHTLIKAWLARHPNWIKDNA